jgi:transposase
MDWRSALREVRRMRFGEVYERFQLGRLSCFEAADILGMSERTFLRYRERYEAEGADGLLDRRVGRASGRRVPTDVVTRVIELYATRYFDFNVKHFHEKLVSDHGFGFSYAWTKRVLQDAGQVKPRYRRGPHRKKRERKPLPGMMLHQDGSRHYWVPDEQWDLIVTLDDATSEIYSAFFVAEEGTMSSFQALLEVIGKKGLFGSLYADRGSHYWITKSTGKGVDRDTPTRSVVRSISLASRSFRPRPRKHADARNACSARSKAGCRRSCAPPASRRCRPPTSTCAKSFCPRTTAASRWPQPSPTPLSSAIPGPISRRCSASRRTAWSAATTVSPISALVCSCRPTATVTITSRPRCACTSTRTAGLRCSADTAALAATTPMAASSPRPRMKELPHEPRPLPSAGRPAACGYVDDPRPAARLRFPSVPYRERWEMLAFAHIPTGPTTADKSCVTKSDNFTCYRQRGAQAA